MAAKSSSVATPFLLLRRTVIKPPETALGMCKGIG